MGGMGSGRSGGRPTVEGCLMLDMTTLLREGLLQRAAKVSGSMTWPTRNGCGFISMGFVATLGAEDGELSLRYSATDYWTGEPRNLDYVIRLVATPQPFGGVRWWFKCPMTGRRVSKLHMPAGRLTFASRQAYRLGYASQRQSPRDRAISQAFKLRRRLGDYRGGVGDCVPKPKWMRRATYERELDRVWAADELCDAHLAGLVERLLKSASEAKRI